MANVANQLSAYQLFIGFICFVLGLIIGSLAIFIIMKKLPLVIGLSIVTIGIMYLLKSDWKYWSWREAANMYLVYAPFLIGFGITVSLFGLARIDI